ncbi:MAG: DUF1127 domain-containing protein [Pseudomonadota bacterium]
MEMHTRESLRRIHGIQIRPLLVNAKTSRLNYIDYTAMAVKLRDRYVCSALAAGVMKFVSVLDSLTASFRNELRYRAAEGSLMQMSEYQLEDIGVQRDQIHVAVRHGRQDGDLM